MIGSRAGTAGGFLVGLLPGIVLGVILGKIGESNFVKTMQMLDYDPVGFAARPISALLLGLAVLTLIFSLRQSIQGSTKNKPA